MESKSTDLSISHQALPMPMPMPMSMSMPMPAQVRTPVCWPKMLGMRWQYVLWYTIYCGTQYTAWFVANDKLGAR